MKQNHQLEKRDEQQFVEGNSCAPRLFDRLREAYAAVATAGLTKRTVQPDR